jgi:hypothetical protein
MCRTTWFTNRLNVVTPEYAIDLLNQRRRPPVAFRLEREEPQRARSLYINMRTEFVVDSLLEALLGLPVRAFRCRRLEDSDHDHQLVAHFLHLPNLFS